MLDVITIGDGMVTMDPKSSGPLRFVHEFERKVGGAELNFAVGSARLGLRTGWISRLGKDEFGRHILHFMRGEGVDVSNVEMVEGYSTSVNFKEVMDGGQGRTFYYRANSPMSTLRPEDLNPEMFAGARILHVTGVFPSIEEKNIAIVRRAIALAKKEGLRISLDPNIRLKMWSSERAREVLLSFLPDIDILLTGEDEAELLFGVGDEKEIVKVAESYGISSIAIKKGGKGAVVAQDSEIIEAEAVPAKEVVDTVGAGDGFDAAFIYGLLREWPLERIAHFATLVGSMVVSVRGDNEGLPHLEDVLVQLGERSEVER
ncbi:2-dehydro-3-deoxygluconokinase [Geomicrobium halophilum]|uniref:2-dehydro-3-deoxygluconokinase n=1 Tax=Geomicrobium halophilum TaxID=549000 RepID=A0A841PYY7_9BACL|nr:sugar kinase [Geomicrobium halophilum]MBB6449993.1 2-dehydro-3-deoxygluconokinase [Geomicrobium halophilum]